MTDVDDRGAAISRMRQGWVPSHSPAALAHLDGYAAETAGQPVDPERFVGVPSGLDHRDIHSVINDRSLAERFFEVHCDFLDPDRSRYQDPIFGSFTGQRAIRAWLVRAMGDVAAVSFDAVFPAEFLDDGAGGTSIDEWQLTTFDGASWVPVTHGVSIRRYRDGWITDAIDYFDTMPVRMGAAAAAAAGGPAMDLPPPPHHALLGDPAWDDLGDLPENASTWLAARAKACDAGTWEPPAATGLSDEDLFHLLFDRRAGRDFDLICDLMHPTASVYIDPVFGHFDGREAIRAWLLDIMGKTGTIEFEALSPAVLDGSVAFQEFRQVAVKPDGTRFEMTRGASVRRFHEGFIVHAADYFDVAPFLDPAVQAASTAAGSTISEADILKYRT